MKNSVSCLLSLLWLALFLLSAQGGAFAESFTGKAVCVIDGSSFMISREGHVLTIRLANVASPAEGQDCCRDAKRFLTSLILEKDVWVDVLRLDSSKHMVCRAICEGRSVNLELVTQGWAWYDGRLRKDADLAAAQKNAQDKKCGLWAGKNPQEPWSFRRSSSGIVPIGLTSREISSKRSSSGSSGGYGFIPASTPRDMSSQKIYVPGNADNISYVSGYGNQPSSQAADTSDHTTGSQTQSASYQAPSAASSSSRETRGTPQVKVVKSRKYVAGTDFIRTAAEVRNMGTSEAKGVEVICLFTNFFGEVFSRDSSYVGDLEPGESRVIEFFSMVRASSRGLDTLSDTLTVIVGDDRVKRLIDVKVEFRVTSM